MNTHSATSALGANGAASDVSPGSRGMPLALPLFAIAVTLVATMALVFWTGTPEPSPTAETERLPVLAARDVFFEDQPDGSVRVIDAKLKRHVEIIAPASNGFLRGAVRGLVRERKRQSIGPEIPFTIAALASGRVVLRDAATAREIDLATFGSTNVEVFARLLPITAAGTKP
jgi:putative photosynthetic complex assembly protein